MTDHTINELCQSVRDIVFDAVTEHLFVRSVDSRYKIAACLDTIEDAQIAIDDYRRIDLSEDQTNRGRLYLVVYGVLQGIFLQQDALRSLAKALRFSFQIDDTPRLKEIRDLRNMIAGHPTSFRRNGKDAFYAISRSTLSLEGFEMLEYIEGHSKRMILIDIKELLADNEEPISKTLRNLRSKLEDDIDKHKDDDEPEN